MLRKIKQSLKKIFSINASRNHVLTDTSGIQEIQKILRFLVLQDSQLKIYHKNRSFNFYLPNSHYDDLQAEIVRSRNFYEIEELDVFLSFCKGLTGLFIDIGANIGNHSVYWMSFASFTKGVAFEPNPQCWEILKRNLLLNNLAAQVEVVEKGLSDKKMQMYSVNNIGPLGLIPAEKEDPYGVECLPLDSFGFENISLIKIDVEGMVDQVLQGAAETIRQCKPKLMIGILSGIEPQGKIEKMLKDLGYTLKWHSVGSKNYFYEYGWK